MTKLMVCCLCPLFFQWLFLSFYLCVPRGWKSPKLLTLSHSTSTLVAYSHLETITDFPFTTKMNGTTRITQDREISFQVFESGHCMANAFKYKALSFWKPLCNRYGIYRCCTSVCRASCTGSHILLFMKTLQLIVWKSYITTGHNMYWARTAGGQAIIYCLRLFTVYGCWMINSWTRILQRIIPYFVTQIFVYINTEKKVSSFQNYVRIWRNDNEYNLYI